MLEPDCDGWVGEAVGLEVTVTVGGIVGVAVAVRVEVGVTVAAGVEEDGGVGVFVLEMRVTWVDPL